MGYPDYARIAPRYEFESALYDTYLNAERESYTVGYVYNIGEECTSDGKCYSSSAQALCVDVPSKREFVVACPPGYLMYSFPTGEFAALNFCYEVCGFLWGVLA